MADPDTNLRPGRAKTEQEKAAVIERLAAVWTGNPHLRLGQLIANVYQDLHYLYYTEDETLIRAIETCYQRPEPGTPVPGEEGSS
jgi:hypothetical protein